MDAVNQHGRALIDDPNRIGKTVAVGLDEVLLCRDGPFKNRLWSTQIVDVARGQLLDIVPGRDARRQRSVFVILCVAYPVG